MCHTTTPRLFAQFISCCVKGKGACGYVQEGQREGRKEGRGEGGWEEGREGGRKGGKEGRGRVEGREGGRWGGGGRKGKEMGRRGDMTASSYGVIYITVLVQRKISVPCK